MCPCHPLRVLVTERHESAVDGCGHVPVCGGVRCAAALHSLHLSQKVGVFVGQQINSYDILRYLIALSEEQYLSDYSYYKCKAESRPSYTRAAEYRS